MPMNAFGQDSAKQSAVTYKPRPHICHHPININMFTLIQPITALDRIDCRQKTWNMIYTCHSETESHLNSFGKYALHNSIYLSFFVHKKLDYCVN